MTLANLALARLYYTGNNDWYGDDGVTITVSDMGYTGQGGVKMDSQTVPITIRPVNDAPELHVFRLPDGTNTVCVVRCGRAPFPKKRSILSSASRSFVLLHTAVGD